MSLENLEGLDFGEHETKHFAKLGLDEATELVNACQNIWKPGLESRQKGRHGRMTYCRCELEQPNGLSRLAKGPDLAEEVVEGRIAHWPAVRLAEACTADLPRSAQSQ